MKTKDNKHNKANLYFIALFEAFTIVCLLILSAYLGFKTLTENRQAISIKIWRLPPYMVIDNNPSGNRLYYKEMSQSDLSSFQEVDQTQISDDKMPILKLSQNLDLGNLFLIDQNSGLYSYSLEEKK